MPRHPLQLSAFGVAAMMPAAVMMRIFETPVAQALFAGNAAHAWTPLSRPPSAATALMFAAVGHRYGWPAVKRGTAQLAAGLTSILRSHGGRIETGVTTRTIGDLGGFDVVLYDTNPDLPARLLGDRIPPRIRRTLTRYRYGAAAFKMDFAVHEGIPWTNAPLQRAGTVHVCGSAEEVIAAEHDTYNTRMPKRPFVIVAQ